MLVLNVAKIKFGDTQLISPITNLVLFQYFCYVVFSINGILCIHKFSFHVQQKPIIIVFSMQLTLGLHYAYGTHSSKF